MPKANVLILVQNAPTPADRRVWQECQTLTRAGYQVTVICPRGNSPSTCAAHEFLDGVEIHRFALPLEGQTLGGHLVEYLQSAWKILALVLRLSLRRRFAIVHVCNPPDFLTLVAFPARLRGARVVLDHHDLVPEMFDARYPRVPQVVRRITRVAEKMNFRLADAVLSTNESYRRLAITRGGKDPRRVHVVRNAPDLCLFQLVKPDDQLRGDKRFLLCYVGMMEPLDNVDVALRVLQRLHEIRNDWRAVLVGEGSMLPTLERMAVDGGIDDVVDFAGWQDTPAMVRILSSADVCLSPECSSEYNNSSTFLKVAEYMAMGRPVVAFDLVETRYTAQNAAEYVRDGDELEFANRLSDLLDDPIRRMRMGNAGRERITGELSWRNSEEALLAAYDQLLGGPVAIPPASSPRSRDSDRAASNGALLESGGPRSCS